jgi:hypothetical protein
MSESDGQSVDGCAIFYKNSKFEMKQEYLLEFERLATQLGHGAPDILNRACAAVAFAAPTCCCHCRTVKGRSPCAAHLL